MFGIPYSRSLHEQIEKQIRGKLQKGQPVLGSLKEKGDKGKSKNNGKNSKQKDGDGSESQHQEWEFHFLLPSDLLIKPQ